MPLDWNKINEEDSSVSGYESTHEDDLSEIQSPSFKKESASEITPKQFKTSKSFNGTPIITQDVVEQNLHKLSLLDSQEVWLFVPKPYKTQKTDEISSTLKDIEKVKKVVPNSSGWNVLIDNKNDAKDLIFNGHKKNKFTLKFYVSTKNHEPNQYSKSSRKGNTENLDNLKTFKSPQKLRKLNYEDQSDKKKVKYLEKVSEKKILPRDKSKQKPMKEKIQQNNEETIENHRNDQTVNEKHFTEILDGERKQDGKAFSDKFVQQEGCQNQNNLKDGTEDQNDEVILEKQIDSPEQPGDEEYDSEESLERMKKALKRKNKKMNKKKGGSKNTDLIDKNNPFSLLS